MRTLTEQTQELVQAEWNSLLATMDYWVSAADELPAPVRELVRDAHYFAYRYKEIFDSIAGDGEVVKILHDEKTDVWTVQHQAREALLSEWDTVRQAVEQHLSRRYAEHLPRLERMAAESIAPLFPELAGEAIVYFHKVFDITRFAFSRMPVIGVPFSALDLPDSWLSIPHEAGHYVFWNGTPSLTEFAAFYAEMERRVIRALTKAFKKREAQGGHFKRSGEIYRTWLLWMNEIFADIYGTLVAGPASGWAIQRILRTRLNQGDLYHSHEDPDHPDAYIRPFVHIATLTAMAEASNGDFREALLEAAKALGEAWRESWSDENLERTLFTPDNWGSMQEVLEIDLPLVVRAILDTRLPGGISLRSRFSDGAFYTFDRHQWISSVVESLPHLPSGETVQVGSPLDMSIIVQLAIVAGVDHSRVQGNFDYQPNEPERADRDRWFEEFLANATGSGERDVQLRAWRRIIRSTASEVAYGGLHHGHAHNH